MTDITAFEDYKILETYEYAGFNYHITQIGEGKPRAVPVPNQHVNAERSVHCQAALECWQENQKRAQTDKV